MIAWAGYGVDSCFLPWAPTGFPMVDRTDLTNCGGVGTVMEDFRILDIAVVWTSASVEGVAM